MSDMKKTAIGATVAAALCIVLVVTVFATSWDDYTSVDTPQEQPTFPNGDPSIWGEDGELVEGSLAYSVFEKYGIILLPLALLMFGAMVGGVVIAREEVEPDDSN